jgi:hypothetical protein
MHTRAGNPQSSLRSTSRPAWLRLMLLSIFVATSLPLRVAGQDSSVDPAAAIEFFENQIRPLLSDHCRQCHGSEKQASGLRVDSRAALIEGGDRGAAVVPGQPTESVLVDAIRHADDLEMPPKETLSPPQIAAIERWIQMGAPWPEETVPSRSTVHSPQRHWAFQPIINPARPANDNDRWSVNEIDSFVRARLDASGLTPSAPADRRTLIRRVHFTLTGLPPTPEAVERFVADRSPRAYQKVVDRLLQSPEYGQHWARHWLDLARYSDTKGYVYAREERYWVHAWTYRDWVIDALNDNMPQDRFLLLQLAADQVKDRRESDMAAMGFLTLGRRFLGVQRDIIDDRIDVVCRGMLGLTVACARCHDHKYDPIPTEDYYSLYGVFDSCRERLVPLQDKVASETFQSELEQRQLALAEKLAASRLEASDRSRGRVVDYLRAQTELHKYPANGFDQIFQKSDLLPAFVRRWEDYLYEARRRHDPVFVAWHAYGDLAEAEFDKQSEQVTRRLNQLSADQINPIVAEQFKSAPRSFDEVIGRYGEIFGDMIERRNQGDKNAGEVEPAGEPIAEPLLQTLYGRDSPCVVPREPIVHTETFFDSATCTALWKLQGEVDRWINSSVENARFALVLNDRPTPHEPRVFRRGNPLNKGQTVTRRFVSVLSSDQSPFQIGSGRLELARAIVHRDNPLTARVLVNRVWAHHFGRGLVLTPSDFGTRAAEPSHPELLDALASRFVSDGWDLKQLHRRILMSATFRQSSADPDATTIGRAAQVDPDNRLLWRMNPRRLSFEAYRDAMLRSADRLDRQMGGKPTPLFEKPYSPRRTVYARVDRQYLPGTLRVFDFANPDLHVPQRGETTVPQQALFLMNHDLVLERAKTLADLAGQCTTPQESVQMMFERTLQRQPTQQELTEALHLVRSNDATEAEAPRETARDWQYGFGAINEAQGSVDGFTPLPYFNGNAWQGGAKWPDSMLGWVQLTAAGGHPGNDRGHAAVRRWTAPQKMTLRIRSDLTHDAQPGDGIRAFIVASGAGILKSEKLHQDRIELNVDSVEVSRGDTIDFVVDIGDILNSDQYLWTATIVPQSTGQQGVASWDSKSDFPRNHTQPIDPWQQLAQILFCTNEFMFVD